MMKEIAIIGDHFMLPEVFQSKLIEACGTSITTRIMKQNWPDEPMEHGYAIKGMEGLKEYFGNADDIVDFIGNAEILVTQLAPMSRAMSWPSHQARHVKQARLLKRRQRPTIPSAARGCRV